MTGRRLQFGSGQNLLPEPWENYDSETDISKPLPFPIGSARFILAEHVIEHVDFRSGVRFLQECLRILEPGGVLRLAFPDITRDFDTKLWKCGRLNVSREDVWYSTLTDFGHQSCWTKDMAVRVLASVGFDIAQVCPYGKSMTIGLSGVDGHHKLVGTALAEAETTVLEAIR